MLGKETQLQEELGGNDSGQQQPLLMEKIGFYWIWHSPSYNTAVCGPQNEPTGGSATWRRVIF